MLGSSVRSHEGDNEVPFQNMRTPETLDDVAKPHD